MNNYLYNYSFKVFSRTDFSGYLDIEKNNIVIAIFISKLKINKIIKDKDTKEKAFIINNAENKSIRVSAKALELNKLTKYGIWSKTRNSKSVNYLKNKIKEKCTKDYNKDLLQIIDDSHFIVYDYSNNTIEDLSSPLIKNNILEKFKPFLIKKEL